jgi:hypothetical protein
MIVKSEASMAAVSEKDARAELEWRNLDQCSGVKRHALFFRGMQYSAVERESDSKHWRVDGTNGRHGALKDAKAEAATHAIDRLRHDGYVEPLRAGRVGGKMAPGEVVLTASGRETTPFPTFNSKDGKTSAKGLKAVDRWLMENALAEAEARGDEFNAGSFRAAVDKPQQADKDSAEEYLFSQQPAVVPSILRPLVTPSVDKMDPQFTATDAYKAA